MEGLLISGKFFSYSFKPGPSGIKLFFIDGLRLVDQGLDLHRIRNDFFYLSCLFKTIISRIRHGSCHDLFGNLTSNLLKLLVHFGLSFSNLLYCLHIKRPIYCEQSGFNA